MSRILVGLLRDDSRKDVNEYINAFAGFVKCRIPDAEISVLRESDLPARPDSWFGRRKLKKLIKKGAYDVVYLAALSAGEYLLLKAARDAGVPKTVVHAFTDGLHAASDADRQALAECATDFLAVSYTAADRTFTEEIAGGRSTVIVPPVIEKEIRQPESSGERPFTIGLAADPSEAAPAISYAAMVAEKLRERLGAVELSIYDPVKCRDSGWLSSIDAFLQPGAGEAFPVMLVKAQYAGLPCLANASLPASAVVSGRCRMMEPGEPGTWAEEIAGLKEMDETAVFYNDSNDFSAEAHGEVFLQIAGPDRVENKIILKERNTI